MNKEKEKVFITVKVDNSCDMAEVRDSEGNGMSGNFWDFHNGCHGLYELENFNSYKELVQVLTKLHTKNGKEVVVGVKNYKFTY